MKLCDCENMNNIFRTILSFFDIILITITHISPHNSHYSVAKDEMNPLNSNSN